MTQGINQIVINYIDIKNIEDFKYLIHSYSIIILKSASMCKVNLLKQISKLSKREGL